MKITFISPHLTFSDTFSSISMSSDKTYIRANSEQEELIIFKHHIVSCIKGKDKLIFITTNGEYEIVARTASDILDLPNLYSKVIS